MLKVVDGDTIHVSVDGQKLKIRMIGLDTPETVDPRKPVHCFGREASAQAKSILGGQYV
ncbi:thermonuclease family protein [Mycobacterium sp. URHB0021]